MLRIEKPRTKSKKTARFAVGWGERVEDMRFTS